MLHGSYIIRIPCFIEHPLFSKGIVVSADYVSIVDSISANLVAARASGTAAGPLVIVTALPNRKLLFLVLPHKVTVVDSAAKDVGVELPIVAGLGKYGHFTKIVVLGRAVQRKCFVEVVKNVH